MIYIEPHNVVSTSSVQIRINVSLKLTADAQLGCGTLTNITNHITQFQLLHKFGLTFDRNC